MIAARSSSVPQDVSKIPLLKKLDNYGCGGNRRIIVGMEIGPLLGSYKNLLEMIPDVESVCLSEPMSSERLPLTHKRLRTFISSEFDLTKCGLPLGARVAVLLPNGPELAVCILSTCSQWCAAPINPTNTWQEIRSELVSTKARAIIISAAGGSGNEAALEAVKTLPAVGVFVIAPTGSITGLFRLNVLKPVPALDFDFPQQQQSATSSAATVEGVVLSDYVVPPPRTTSNGFTSFSHPETVLLLHTSGTSGNKKLVPYSLDMLMVGVGCIVSSWNLYPSDVCLNMMPLFHIGGIVRNIFSPILSGGSVISCSGFDPILFWDVLSSTRVTWYYAAPTMHHAILMEGETRPKPLPVASIRYIANAAGGLLPVLAEQLRSTFDATILTSYGMTECMPISSPPQSYQLDPIGTSGIAVGPEVLIVDDDLKPVKKGSGVAGNIFVRGPPCFGGYENNDGANDESFFTIGTQAGWFNTGDMGSINSTGYLFISGRSKEIINRGGETISPFEIEEAVVQHKAVNETLAFSAPHDQFQETVGVVIVTRPDQQRVDLPALHKYLEDKLHRSKWPQVIVFMNALPKNAAGKILRIKLADRFEMAPVDEEASPLLRLFEATCPPSGSPLTLKIPTTQVLCDHQATEQLLLSFGGSQDAQENTEGGGGGGLGIAGVAVTAAAVVKLDLPFRQDAFVAFVVITREKGRGGGGGGGGSEEDVCELLLKKCEEKLPHYQVPVFVHALSALPVDNSSSLASSLPNSPSPSSPSLSFLGMGGGGGAAPRSKRTARRSPRPPRTRADHLCRKKRCRPSQRHRVANRARLARAATSSIGGERQGELL